MDRTQSGDTTPSQSGPGNNGNEGVLCIHESDCFVSYPGHSLVSGGVFYISVGMQSVYYAAQADWTTEY